MGKTIKKTALLTVLSLIAVSFLTVFAIFVFAPKTAGDFCNDMGMKKIALSCYEREYNKTGEFDDLIFLFDYAIFEDDYGRVTKYGEIALSRTTDFECFCAQSDLNKAEGAYPTYDYYTTAIVDAYYAQGKKQDVAVFALNHVPSKGYSETTALYYAVQLAKDDTSLLKFLGDEYGNGIKWTFTGKTTFKKEIEKLGYN